MAQICQINQIQRIWKNLSSFSSSQIFSFKFNKKTNLTVSLGKYCTVFQAEIFVILSCAQRGIEQGYKNKRILILSDSQAALKALDSYQFKSKLVWNCLQEQLTLSQNNSVAMAMHGETIRASWTFPHKKTMVKYIPIIGHEGPWGMWMQGCTYLCIHSHGTRKK